MRRALAALTAACGLAAHAEVSLPIAFVADLHGNATIEGDGKLRFLAELASGTKLLLGTGSTVSVTYVSTGSEFVLKGPGEFLVDSADVKAERGPPPSRKTVSALSGAGVVAKASQASTASVRMRSLRPDAKAVLEFPVETRIATLRPELRWRDARTAQNYLVSLRDAEGKELWKATAQTRAATPALKLTPATQYRWTVATAEGILGEATFETLPADALKRAERSHGGARSFSARVVHALLLQDLGAYQEAAAAWEILARERPDLPELAALAQAGAR